MNLAHLHGLQAGLMTLWRDTRTAGRIYINRRLRQICLGQQSIGNYADIRAKSDKSNAFDLLFLIHGHKSCCQCGRSKRLLIDRFRLAQHIQLLPDLPAVFLTVLPIIVPALPASVKSPFCYLNRSKASCIPLSLEKIHKPL